MRRYVLFALLVFLCLACVPLGTRVNEARLFVGENPIPWNNAAAAVAQKRANGMAAEGELRHLPNLEQDLERVGLSVEDSAEIIGRTNHEQPIHRIVSAFMESPTHRRILLDNWEAFGAGGKSRSGFWYFSVVFVDLSSVR